MKLHVNDYGVKVTGMDAIKRAAEIVNRRAKGESFQKIADTMGITRERVRTIFRQALKKAGKDKP